MSSNHLVNDDRVMIRHVRTPFYSRLLVNSHPHSRQHRPSTVGMLDTFDWIKSDKNKKRETGQMALAKARGGGVPCFPCYKGQSGGSPFSIGGMDRTPSRRARITWRMTLYLWLFFFFLLLYLSLSEMKFLSFSPLSLFNALEKEQEGDGDSGPWLRQGEPKDDIVSILVGYWERKPAVDNR